MTIECGNFDLIDEIELVVKATPFVSKNRKLDKARPSQQTEVGKGKEDLTDHEFNVKLFLARKITEHKIIASKLSQSKYFYFPSLSTHTLIYKGLLVPEDIEAYYLDLSEPLVVTRLALVHQRFSTNTFPTWDLAQPFRYMCHNGEINTFRGNASRMQIREELFKSDLILGTNFISKLVIIQQIASNPSNQKRPKYLGTLA